MAEHPDGPLARRIDVLQSAYRLATAPDADRDDVVRLLEEHGLADLVPPPSNGSIGELA